MKWNLFTLMVLIAFCTQSEVQAQDEIWAYACGFTADPDFEQGNMYSIDPLTGDGTLVGTLCGGGVGAVLTGEFVNGTYYAIDNSSSELFSVASDGSCSTPVTITGATSGTLSGLSHDLSTGLTYLLTTDGGSSSLHSLDLSTGVATVIGNTGTSLAISLVIDINGNAYILDVATDAIHPIDLTTGVAGVGVPITEGGVGVDINFAQDADFDCSADGMLSGILYEGGGTGQFGSLDPLTGEFVEIAFIGTEMCGYSVDCRSDVEIVPTMGEWGLISLGMLLLIFGVVAVDQKKASIA